MKSEAIIISQEQYPSTHPTNPQQNAEENACKPSSFDGLLSCISESHVLGTSDLVLNFKDLANMLLACFDIQKVRRLQPSEEVLLREIVQVWI